VFDGCTDRMLKRTVLTSHLRANHISPATSRGEHDERYAAVFTGVRVDVDLWAIISLPVTFRCSFFSTNRANRLAPIGNAPSTTRAPLSTLALRSASKVKSSEGVRVSSQFAVVLVPLQPYRSLGSLRTMLGPARRRL
jgi:hypothetical protein